MLTVRYGVPRLRFVKLCCSTLFNDITTIAHRNYSSPTAESESNGFFARYERFLSKNFPRAYNVHRKVIDGMNFFLLFSGSYYYIGII